jgi:hypothetical protein
MILFGAKCFQSIALGLAVGRRARALRPVNEHLQSAQPLA